MTIGIQIAILSIYYTTKKFCINKNYIKKDLKIKYIDLYGIKNLKL